MYVYDICIVYSKTDGNSMKRASQRELFTLYVSNESGQAWQSTGLWQLAEPPWAWRIAQLHPAPWRLYRMIITIIVTIIAI